MGVEELHLIMSSQARSSNILCLAFGQRAFHHWRLEERSFLYAAQELCGIICPQCQFCSWQPVILGKKTFLTLPRAWFLCSGKLFTVLLILMANIYWTFLSVFFFRGWSFCSKAIIYRQSGITAWTFSCILDPRFLHKGIKEDQRHRGFQHLYFSPLTRWLHCFLDTFMLQG